MVGKRCTPGLQGLFGNGTNMFYFIVVVTTSANKLSIHESMPTRVLFAITACETQETAKCLLLEVPVSGFGCLESVVLTPLLAFAGLVLRERGREG